MKVHDKAKRPRDKGSKDHGLVYVSFNAGMFLALKANMMKIAKEEFDVNLVRNPKVEFYGSAEERMCLDLKAMLNKEEHLIK